MPILARPYKQCVDNKRILQSFDVVRYRYRYLVKNFLVHKFLLYLFINNERLYVPDKPNIRRREILSNPDMICVNNETDNFDFIIEVESQINYKKIVGISLLTEIAIRQKF